MYNHQPKILGVMFLDSADDCPKVFGLDLCWDKDCDDSRVEWDSDWKDRMPHAHVGHHNPIFSGPLHYPLTDVVNAGLQYRVGKLPAIGIEIRWDHYDVNDPRRVLHFEPSVFLV